MHGDDLHQRTDSDADTAGNRIQPVKPSLAIVGAGKVGATLARLCFARGYGIETVYSRTFGHAEALATRVGAQAVETADEVRGVLALIAVPDDAVGATAEALKGFNGRAAVHTSGVHDANALEVLAARGVQVGGLHPVYPFTDVERSIAGLPGATFAVEASDEPLKGWLGELVVALDGWMLVIPAGGKALYHAALAMMSSYTVTLYALAEKLLLGLGAEKTAADHALVGLLAGAVENLRVQGIPNALTGPLTRVDVKTIAAHMDALGAVAPQIAEAYQQLARLTYPLLLERGITAEEIARIERLFRDSTGM
ncbi:MAG: DUF2520 domain-containing protein [Chloroflexota bacterium]